MWWEAVVLGLATAPYCALACAPVFLPVVLSREATRFRANALALAQFLGGRLAAYVLVGALAGGLGAAVPELPRWAPVAVYALLGAALLAYAVSEFAHRFSLCRVVSRWGRRGEFPAALGFLTGLNICPPFAAAVAGAVKTGGVAQGVFFFLVFFVTTSLVSLPMLVAAWGNLLPAVRWVGRAACAVAGGIFLLLAVHAAAPTPNIAAEITGMPPAAAAEPRAVPNLTRAEIERAGLSTREAMYYEKAPGGNVRCLLCPTACFLGEGERGLCRARINLGGALRTLVYGRLVAVHDDPIEKKPLFHFLPKSRSLSIATAGCNLGCVFCQNWEISQALPEQARHRVVTPEQVVAAARAAGCQSIAYTYTEPTAFYEFMLDTARLARREGIRNVWITCGYINPEPLRELCTVLDAANIDLKGFSEEFYRQYCGGSLAPVLEAIKIARREGVWVEVTNLLVPGGNDTPALIRDLCRWHAANLGADAPLHFSRFFPRYRMTEKAPTPADTLALAAGIAKAEGLRYIYLGNIALPGGGDTRCPQCGRLLIQRQGFDVLRNELAQGKCPACGAPIAGIWATPSPPSK